MSDLFHDSNDVVPGSGFVAIRGARVDGHHHAAAACAAGASVVVVDHELPVACTQLIVADTRAALPRLAATVHGNPAAEMRVVGVTGTNGKTTVTHMIESIVVAAGGLAGVVGTVGAHIGGDVAPLARTTPEATDLQRLLRAMADRGVDTCALEVSSHALVFGRADAIFFDAVVFTNLTQDHLDFHHTMEEYFAAKARLFTKDRAAHAIIWLDDRAGARLATETLLPTTTVGFEPGCDVVGEVEHLEPDGTTLFMTSAGQRQCLRVAIGGRFNAANALLAAATALQIGLDREAVAAGLESLTAVPGRFERVPNDLGLTVIVDYAHTPDAVAASIATAAEIATGRVIAVAGAAGDRDKEKRRPMGAAAATADIAIITSDNPRSEDPEELVAEVLAGAGGASSSAIGEVDRRLAIRKAIALASRGDMVLILGKGHEPYQQFADRVVAFDDRIVAGEEIALAGDVR